MNGANRMLSRWAILSWAWDLRVELSEHVAELEGRKKVHVEVNPLDPFAPTPRNRGVITKIEEPVAECSHRWRRLIGDPDLFQCSRCHQTMKNAAEDMPHGEETPTEAAPR